ARRRARILDGIGDRFVEKHVLAGARRGSRGLAVRRVGRRVDDRLDRAIFENLLVAARGAAAVSGGELLPLLVRARIARADGELTRALHRIGDHIGPPAHTQTGDTQRSLHLIDSAASRATRSSNCQSPPATPTAPMHSLPAMTGQPPSIAVQRSGPAASARPTACVTSSAWPCAPLAPVARRLDAAQTAFVVAECTV